MNTSQPWRLIRFQWLLVYYFQLSVLADAFLRRIRLSTKQPSSYSFPPCLWINPPAISTIITAKKNISEAIKVEDERTCRGKKTPCTLKTVESDGEHQWKNQETRLKRGINMFKKHCGIFLRGDLSRKRIRKPNRCYFFSLI